MVFFQPSGRRLGDFEIVVKEGNLWCMFIDRDKKHMVPESAVGNNYGLAVSADGFSWNYLGSVFEGKSEWNKGSLWAMGVFNKGNEFYMMYSAVETLKGKHHYMQQVGVAVSKDLKKWKDKGIAINNEMTKEVYSPKGVGKFCWRDPYVFKVDADYYCLLAARDVKKKFEKSGCIALLKSKDLKNWETLGPLFSPGKYDEIEVPSLYELDGRWFLLFGVCKDEIYNMKYAIGESALGPFKEMDGNDLLPTNCYIGKIVDFEGQKLLFHWVRSREGGRVETYLAPPKVVEVKGEVLLLRKHPALEKYWEGAEKNVKGKKEIFDDGKFREIYVDGYFVDGTIEVK